MLRAAVLALLAALLVPASVGAGDASQPEKRDQVRKQWRRAFESAERYARGREGRVSFAVIDGNGRLRAHRGRRHYHSASLVKAMLLVSYLNRRGIRDRPLDEASRGNLRPMITKSDNDAATRIYSVVGPRGLIRLARRAGMRGLITAQGWSDTLVTAADQARFFARIDRLVVPRHRGYARWLLAHVVAPQRWGIPPALPDGARAFIKGGWRPEAGAWLVHQAGLVQSHQTRASIAVLTDDDRSEAYGHATIRGVARRALRPLARTDLYTRLVSGPQFFAICKECAVGAS